MNLDGKMPYQSHFISKPDVIGSYSDYANIVIIDSKDRNKMLYRNANDYTITLKSPFYDVSEVELISIYYKYSHYEFDKRNNKIFIKNISKDKQLTVPISKGNYTYEDLIKQFDNQYTNVVSMNNIGYSIYLKYSTIMDKYYFIVDNSDIFSIDFKGNEVSYSANLYGNRQNDTGIFEYKKETNGKYFGFSANIFKNKLDVNVINMTNTNTAIFEHDIKITFDNVNSYSQLIDSLQLFDSDMMITFIVNGSSKIISNTNIKGFEILSANEVKIRIILDENMGSLVLQSPTIYTNIVVGDIMRSDDRDKYVLLDIKEFNRLHSLNDNIQNSYVKIPITQSEHIYYDNTKNYGTIKSFNPILKQLDRLSIKIKDRNGYIMDDNGLDHTMVFAIKCLNNKTNLRS